MICPLVNDDGIGRYFHQRAVPFLAFPQCVFGLLPVGDVTGNHRDACYFSIDNDGIGNRALPPSIAFIFVPHELFLFYNPDLSAHVGIVQLFSGGMSIGQCTDQTPFPGV